MRAGTATSGSAIRPRASTIPPRTFGSFSVPSAVARARPADTAGRGVTAPEPTSPGTFVGAAAAPSHFLHETAARYGRPGLAHGGGSVMLGLFPGATDDRGGMAGVWRPTADAGLPQGKGWRP